MEKLPHVKRPCRDCPFRADASKGWLGEDRASELLSASSFVCHKNTSLQCAGHMLINGQDNSFVQVATRLGIQLDLKGEELVFKSKDACIEHHSRSRESIRSS